MAKEKLSAGGGSASDSVDQTGQIATSSGGVRPSGVSELSFVRTPRGPRGGRLRNVERRYFDVPAQGWQGNVTGRLAAQEFFRLLRDHGSYSYELVQILGEAAAAANESLGPGKNRSAAGFAFMHGIVLVLIAAAKNLQWEPALSRLLADAQDSESKQQESDAVKYANFSARMLAAKREKRKVAANV